MSDRPIGRSEIGRRSEYFEILEKSKKEHPFVQLIQECLDNNPSKRPNAERVLAILKELKVGMEGILILQKSVYACIILGDFLLAIYSTKSLAL